MENLLKIISLGTCVTGICSCSSGTKTTVDDRPNIIVILADDLGYSDLGCYGGEINTPNLDMLANQGIRFNRFYNAGRSCPTRASLLTGLYPHQAGIGRMTFNESLPGYRGQMTTNGVTIAEALRDAGYNTGMTGKWHVSETQLRPDQREWLAHHVEHDTFADINSYPTRRGFNDFYGIIYGVVDYFDPFSLVNGETPVKNVPENYYITDAISDSTVSYINRYSQSDNPFFIYLSYTAPHWPLHVPEEGIRKYEKTYKEGWEKVREARYERMKKLKIFNHETDYLSARQSDISWSNNPDSVWDARAMAVHAAMVDHMDQGIGRVIESLKKNGKWENTLIIFLSDNGCSPELCQFYSPGENDRPDMMRNGTPIVYPTKKEILPGPENTYASIGPEWANVANTPFRFWKAKTYDGGICTPMIAHWPKGIQEKAGSINSDLGHIIDIMATCIDLGKAKYPTQYQGNQIIPLEGKSLDPIFKTGNREGHPFIAFEHFNEKALVTNDGWKIVQPGKEKSWELYNLNEDRSEMKNLSADYTQKVEELNTKYDEWAKRCMVVPQP